MSSGFSADSSIQSSWTVAGLLGWTEDYFRRRGLPTPRLDAELLLAEALGGTRLDLYTGYRKPVEPTERARFRGLVARRARREPVAYLLGRKEFYSLSFQVSPAVLIPRPESEHVVEAALEVLDARPAGGSRLRLLDLGTGSGNLGITLAVQRSDVFVDAVDASERALEVARENARQHGVSDRVRFLRGDLFHALDGEPERYALILSNPPYVARGELETLMDDVRLHEPLEALADSKSPDGDGLGFYRAIAREAAKYLEPAGSVIVEVGAGRAPAVRDLLAESGLDDNQTMRDLAGIERVVVARRRR